MQRETLKYDDLNNEDFLQRLSLLKEYDYDKFMRVLYDSFEEYPERIESDPYPLAIKVEALSRVLKYFKDIEEYEKCEVIKNILNGIKKKDIPDNS